MIKKFIFISFLLISYICNADFAGKWCWDKDDDTAMFSLTIKKSFNIYHGSYDAVALRGNKIDDEEDAFNFRITKKNIVKTKLKTGISGAIGIVQLEIIHDKKINWLVLEPPDGEFYFPKKATLYRCKGN